MASAESIAEKTGERDEEEGENEAGDVDVVAVEGGESS